MVVPQAGGTQVGGCHLAVGGCPLSVVSCPTRSVVITSAVFGARDLLFFREAEKQIPRFARDDNSEGRRDYPEEEVV
jgi:hypothetical protein